MAIKWKIESVQLRHFVVDGNWTLEKAAEYYGVTKQRIQQVVARYMPDLLRKDFGASKALLERKASRIEQIRHRYNRETYLGLTDLERAQSLKFTRKKQNARHTGWGWDVTMSDMDWPRHCPILGVELDYFAESTQENSPSFDRIDSTKGYIKGNVHILSWRANRIKNDGTAEEHRKIADFLDSL